MEQYIGITDFPNYPQVQQMRTVFESLAPGRLKLMVGVMMNMETLHGEKSPWDKVWPPANKIGSIFQSHPKVFNTLHWSDFHDKTTAADIAKALQYCNSHNGLDALQLDMPWPNPEMVWKGIQDSKIPTRDGIAVILMVGRKMVDMCDNSMTTLMDKLGEYQHLVDGILLDMSGGRGVPMEHQVLREYVIAIKKNHPLFAVTVAGGLGPETMHLVKPLIQEFPWLSIDAQGKLRKSGDSKDPIDWPLAEAYLRAAIPMFM